MLNSIILAVVLMGATPDFDLDKHITGLGSASFATREKHTRIIAKRFAESETDEEVEVIWNVLVEEYNTSDDLEVKHRCARLLEGYSLKFDITKCTIWSLSDKLRFVGDRDVAVEYYRKAWKLTHGQFISSYNNDDAAYMGFALYIQDLISSKKHNKAMKVVAAAQGANQIIVRYWGTWFNTNHPPPGVDTLIFNKLRGVTIQNHHLPIHLTSEEQQERLAKLAENAVPIAPTDEEIEEGVEPNIDDIDTDIPRPPAPPPDDEEDE